MNYILSLSLAFFICYPEITFSQMEIEVADLTIKIGIKSEEVVYFAFEEGDEIIFSFKEINDKELKEIEIFEFPNNIKYQNYESSEILKKQLKVGKRAVYGFRLKNTSLKKRICSVQISRICENEKFKDFDTSIDWVEKFDTAYSVKTENVIVGYETIIKDKSRRVLEKVDTNVVTILDRLERVHSTMKLGSSNLSEIQINLPVNKYEPNILTPHKKTEVISWAYSIAVGESGKNWYEKADAKTFANSSSELAVSAGLLSSGYGALAVLAVEGMSAFANPPEGENVKFNILNQEEGQFITGGNSVAASGRVTKFLQGNCILQLINDNFVDAINVEVKIIAVTLTKTFVKEKYTVEKEVPIRENQTSKIPNISVSKVPVMRAQKK
jgi:hypothetical protein